MSTYLMNKIQQTNLALVNLVLPSFEQRGSEQGILQRPL